MSTTETETTRASAAEIRDGLTHPIIDSDAHWLEFGPLVQERMYEIGGEKALAGFTGTQEIVPIQGLNFHILQRVKF